MATDKTLQEILPVLNEARDWVNERTHGVVTVEFDLHTLTGIRLFLYGFNTYKSILLLLPELYFEQASALLRTLWETTLNFVWIAKDPQTRVEQYLGFTAVEYKRTLQNKAARARLAGQHDQATELESAIPELEDILDFQLTRYRKNPARKGLSERYSLGSLEQVARDVGGVWHHEYHRLYKLACAYSHGSPGAVIFPLQFQVPGQTFEEFTSVDRRRSAITGLWALSVLERLYATLRDFLALELPNFPNDFDEKTNYRQS